MSPTKRPSKVHGFLIAIELEDRAPNTPESLALRLGGSCQYMDGVVGCADVDYMGVVDVKEPDDQAK